MKITKVTMTGADDSINPESLFEISEKYPFVEWGILCSRNSQGGNRFPSEKWIAELEQLDSHNFSMEAQFSCHLCGAYVREILMGNIKFVSEIGQAWAMFQRVQINTHGIVHKFDQHAMGEALRSCEDKEFIFQYDNANRSILEAAKNEEINLSTLFDLSHGAGTLPDKWPFPINNISCGYAGGLSPENIESQLKEISTKVGERSIWVDAETKIRSNNDRLFDLVKVRTFLELCKPYIY